MIFLGAWFGKHEPDFHIIFPTIAHRLRKLETEGLEIQNPENEARVITLTLLSFQGDNPAKNLLLEKEKIYCPTCEQPRIIKMIQEK